MMSKHFDATTKELLEYDPRDWMRLLLGREVGEVRVLNVDLSTITSEADSVLLVDESEPWIVHLEFQTSHDSNLPLRLQRYNILVHYRHQLPVQTIVLLLCPEADGPSVTGLLQHRLPDGLIYHEFRYNVVRTWERLPAEFLTGGLATLPLAPLASVKESALAQVIQAIQERLDREATKNQAEMLWTATYLLMGLKYSGDLTDELFQGVRNMKESVTYQKILREGRAEGRAEEAKRILKRQGSRRFGKPDANIEAALDAIADLDTLEQLSDRVLEVTGWEELLARP
jgi:predicted transposase YdaD